MLSKQITSSILIKHVQHGSIAKRRRRRRRKKMACSSKNQMLPSHETQNPIHSIPFDLQQQQHWQQNWFDFRHLRKFSIHPFAYTIIMKIYTYTCYLWTFEHLSHSNNTMVNGKFCDSCTRWCWWLASVLSFWMHVLI